MGMKKKTIPYTENTWLIILMFIKPLYVVHSQKSFSETYEIYCTWYFYMHDWFNLFIHEYIILGIYLYFFKFHLDEKM